LRPSVNVLYLPGTNCHDETVRAFASVGGAPRLRFVDDLVTNRSRLDDADIVCIPGGFSYGDHLGAGAVAALLLRTRLRDQLDACLRRPFLCICNGFQIAVRARCFGPGLALAENACGTFRNVPEQPHVVAPANANCWLLTLEQATLVFPCAHGEGRLIYTSSEAWRPALRYPSGQNPDGSMDDIAGITTLDGLTLGLMNHPERAIHRTANLTLFESGVQAART
jgi:phosphoribosylformylglycinamidine synthase subunit PurQ / glutaminase